MDDETEKAIVQELKRIRVRLVKIDKRIWELERYIDHIHGDIHYLDCY